MRVGQGERKGPAIRPGAVGTAAGLAVAFATGNAFAGGAVGAAFDDATTGALGGHVSWRQFAGDTAVGGVFGFAAEGLAPAVRGGSNFNPFASARTFGPRAMQAYAAEAIADAFGVAEALAGHNYAK